MDEEREETKLPGCLLVSDVKPSSVGPVLVCGKCPNKSSDIGNLGEQCVQVPR